MKILDLGSHIHESKAIVSDLGGPKPNSVIRISSLAVPSLSSNRILPELA